MGVRWVGFSTVNSPNGRGKSSKDAAKDIVTFWMEWIKDFPQLADNPLFIAGESKAGQYVPAWGKAILEHNRKGSHKINLRGILMGNPCTDYAMQVLTKL